MLTESDRVQLAPYLTRIHAARAAVPGAERAAEQAERDAARECQAVRHPIDALVETVRDATQNGRDEKARQEAVSARLRYPGHLRQAAKAVAALKFAVEPVSEAAALAGTPAPSLRWHDTAFDRLPRTAEGVAVLGRLARELPKLRGTRNRVDRLRADLLEVQRRTARAQRAAMIGARDRLLEESAP